MGNIAKRYVKNGFASKPERDDKGVIGGQRFSGMRKMKC